MPATDRSSGERDGPPDERTRLPLIRHIKPVSVPGLPGERTGRTGRTVSPPGARLEWHDAPHRQYVLTLTGTLEFTTRDGETCRLGPGDVLLAEDTAGGGHRWRLLGDQPWTRVYVQLP